MYGSGLDYSAILDRVVCTVKEESAAVAKVHFTVLDIVPAAAVLDEGGGLGCQLTLVNVVPAAIVLHQRGGIGGYLALYHIEPFAVKLHQSGGSRGNLAIDHIEPLAVVLYQRGGIGGYPTLVDVEPGTIEFKQASIAVINHAVLYIVPRTAEFHQSRNVSEDTILIVFPYAIDLFQRIGLLFPVACIAILIRTVGIAMPRSDGFCFCRSTAIASIGFDTGLRTGRLFGDRAAVPAVPLCRNRLRLRSTACRTGIGLHSSGCTARLSGNSRTAVSVTICCAVDIGDSPLESKGLVALMVTIPCSARVNVT